MAESVDKARERGQSTRSCGRAAKGDAMETRVHEPSVQTKRDAPETITTTEYCERLQEWMWQYHYSYLSWQSWLAVSALSFPPCFTEVSGADSSNGDLRNWLSSSFALPGVTGAVQAAAPRAPAAATQTPRPQQQNGNAHPPGREYAIPTPMQRLLAETVDFFILFFIKATIIISIVHLSGMKDISKFAMHFIVEEIDEETSMEDLQKMMLVAFVYRILVCFYEIICIWGAGGATPGKFLIGLRVVTCDSSVLVQPNRVLVVPATNVTLSASTVRALNKNFSIAFFFPAFITLLFFQHNRTVYDIVAGTIVVKRNRLR